MTDSKTSNKKKYTLVVSAILVFILAICSTMIIEDVPNGEIVVNQYPGTGEIAVWSEPGVQWQLFGTSERYDKAFQFWFGSEGKGRPRGIVFNDAGNGTIKGSVRILLPKGELAMEKIHAEFGSLSNLEEELIAPTINKIITATGPLLSSYESYALKKNDLIYYVEDQLRYGIYKTTQTEVTTVDPITGEEKVVKRAEPVPSDDPSVNYFERQEKAPFGIYQLDLTQLSIDEVTYDKTITDQIKAQQEAAMAVQTSIAEAKKAEQDALKEEALGKQLVARARAEQTVEKEKAIVQAEQQREVSRLNQEAAEFYKQEQILIGQGDAERKRLVMEADGALEQKLATMVEITKLNADAIKNYKGAWVPSVMMGGSNANGNVNAAMDLINLMSVQAAKDLSLDLKATVNN